ncbi:hypothetical protein FF1_017983 [Malus domestica]
MVKILPIIMKSSRTGRASSFFQKLLCREKDERRVICLPCHQYLITDKMVWTESSFTLLQSILNYNVHSTQSSDDHIVYQAQQLARIFFQFSEIWQLFVMLSQQMFSALEASQAYID